MLHFGEHELGHEHGALDKTRAADIGNAAIDNHRGVEQQRPGRATFAGRRPTVCPAAEIQDTRQVTLAGDHDRDAHPGKKDESNEWQDLPKRGGQQR